MARRKLPADAFDYYVELGVDRSYRAVADHYGVSKVAVVNRAKKELWQDQLRDLERQARQRTEKKAVDQMEAVHERQLKAARYLQSRAIEAMRGQPPEKAIRAAGALSIGWKHELLLLGEPTERQSNVEEIIKREYERWMVVEGGDDAGDGTNKTAG